VQVAAAEEQLKQAKSKEELDRCTAELAARRITLDKLIDLQKELIQLQKEREARLERRQSEAGAATSGIGAINLHSTTLLRIFNRIPHTITCHIVSGHISTCIK
jgi:hypothetical protein